MDWLVRCNRKKLVVSEPFLDYRSSSLSLYRWHLHCPHRLLLGPLATASILRGRVDGGMAEQRRHRDEIAHAGAPVRITWGTGVTCGMIILRGAHTRRATKIHTS